MREECSLELRGKVKKMVKKKNEKNYLIVFDDGREYQIVFYDLNSMVDIGDSLIKHKNTFTFVIYKPDRPDSVIYVAESRLYKCQNEDGVSN